MGSLFGESYFVIDIGSKNIKLLHGKMVKEQFVIMEYEIIPTPENAIRDGKILDTDKLVHAIRPFHSKCKGSKLIFTIAGTSIISREIMLPKSNIEELQSMLDFEAYRYFPKDFSDYSFDFKVLEEVEDLESNDASKSVMFRIQMVAVPLKIAEEYMLLHKILGSKIEAIDIHPNTLSKSADSISPRISDAKNKTIAILDIGAETMQVVINTDGKLKFAKMLSKGSKFIDILIETDEQSYQKDFEQIKLNSKGLLTEEEKLSDPAEIVSVSEKIETVIMRLMEEISDYFDFYHSRSGLNRISKVFLTGGGCKIKRLAPYLTEFFQIPVELIPKFENVQYKGKKSKGKFDDDRFYLFSAIGNLKRESK